MRTAVLQVITDTDLRGAQVFAVDLHRALEKRGRAVRTVALIPGLNRGLDVQCLGTSRLAPKTLAALRAEIRGARVVVAHGSTTLPACAIASLGTGTPFVYRQISDSLFWAPTRLRQMRVRAGLARARKVVTLWSGAADTLHAHFGVPRDRLAVIPNGVPPERFPPVKRNGSEPARVALGLAPDRPTVAYIGALAPEKGVDLAIEAVGIVPTAQLLVVGAGPDRARLEALAQQFAPSRVVFVGSTPDPLLAFAAADVLVLPSRGGDSMPAVLIEAAFAGVPVVSTPVEGIPEVVVPDVTGLLVSSGSAEALAAAVERIVRTRGLAAKLTTAAREYCTTRYAIDRVAAQWDDVLTGIIEGVDHESTP
jgi:glycosyltransferase involved in cell wall biosynthesis